MPVDWVDGVTWVNAANLEIMEADIAAKQPTADKGAANGYAPLDATSKVPLVNLPPVSGVDYIGDWGAGIAYKKGDVVRYGGKDYMAVNDSTGVTPPPPAGATITPGTSYGTSLPSTGLYDGMEAILVDSLTNPSYQWRFRYNAGSTAPYKWEFVGGAPWAIMPLEFTPPSAAAYHPDTRAASAVVVPRAGEYVCQALCGTTPSAVEPKYMGFNFQQAFRQGSLSGGASETTISAMERWTFAAGATVANVFYCVTTVTPFVRRFLSVIPVRVS